MNNERKSLLGGANPAPKQEGPPTLRRGDAACAAEMRDIGLDLIDASDRLRLRAPPYKAFTSSPTRSARTASTPPCSFDRTATATR